MSLTLITTSVPGDHHSSQLCVYTGCMGDVMYCLPALRKVVCTSLTGFGEGQVLLGVTKWTLTRSTHRTRKYAIVLRHEGSGHYARNPTTYQQRALGILYRLQPATAHLGFIGCILNFIFFSASWWDTPASATKFLGAYGVVS